MIIVFSETQLQTTVDFLVKQNLHTRNELIQAIHSCMKNLVKSGEPYIQTMGFFIYREINLEDASEIMHIFIDPSFNKPDLNYKEINIHSDLNLN